MRLVLIQVLRACAAGLVVMHHAQHEAAVLAQRSAQSFAPSALLPWPAGVDVFFVISGFIIVHASRPLYGRHGGRRRFLAHRVARLVPLYWLVTALYLGLALATPSILSGGPERGLPAPGYVLASFLFWPALRPDGTPQPLYTLGWTLNCEMFFYALFAVGLGWGRRAAVAWTAASLGLLAVASALAPTLPMPLAFWTNPIVLEFALGAGIGLARAEGVRLSAPLRLALALAGLCLLSLAGEPEGFARVLAWGGPATLLVAAAGLGSTPIVRRERPPPVLRWPAALGDASYALYLVHPFALRGGREAIHGLGLGPFLGPQGSLALMLGLAVLTALAVHRLVERPVTRRARALLDPEATRSAVVA